MAFSWFSREKGKGNILDPLGISTGGSTRDLANNAINPFSKQGSSPASNLFNPIGNILGTASNSDNIVDQVTEATDPWRKRNPYESKDQQFAHSIDPGNLFGQKQRSSVLGPSRIDLNKQRFYDQTANDTRPQFESSYSGMLRR